MAKKCKTKQIFKKLMKGGIATLMLISFVGCGKAKITRIDVPPEITMAVEEIHTIEAVFLTEKSNVSAKSFESAIEALNPKWESGNENIVKVDDSGTVTAIAPGETKVLVTTSDSALIGSTIVKVEEKQVADNNLEIESVGEENGSENSEDEEESSSSENKKDTSLAENNNQGNENQVQKRCPTCGSTQHTIHPTYTPKCQICGSTQHTTHPTCPVCGSYEHEKHPAFHPKCPICGSEEHVTHPSCPTCGSMEHTTHPSTGNPTPVPTPVLTATPMPTPQPSDSGSTIPNPTTPPSGNPTPVPTATPAPEGNHCPTCGSTQHRVCYICPSCGIVHTA